MKEADQTKHVSNRDAARLLTHIALLLEAKGEKLFRVRAYQEAAATIDAMQPRLVDLWREGKLQTIRGVGPSIASKLADFLETGRSQYEKELERSLPAGVEHLMNVPGIGPARARKLAEELGIRTPEELARAAEEHRIRTLPGFGERSEERLLIEARRWAQRDRRLLLGIAWPIADQTADLLRTKPGIERVSLGGSLRRRRETIGDIDLLASGVQPAAITAAFAQLPVIREILAHGPTKVSAILEAGPQIDLRVVAPESWGAALQYFTGSKQHNIALRDIAIGRGFKLNEYGLFDDHTGQCIASETEEDIYHALGMDWIPPELREDRGEIQAAEAHGLPTLIEQSALRGDMHVHTNWSDGTTGIAAMAVAARDLGLDYLAITDHTQSLTIAHGLTSERFQQQRRELDHLNEQLAPFRLFAGAEIDIGTDGSLDLPDSTLDKLDYVSVSIHSHFRMSRDAMTRRIIKAICHPRVMTLNHPTGRLIGLRPGYDVDLEAVLRVAASEYIALEINSQMNRLDLNDIWSRRAKNLGCQFFINSDAHGPEHFTSLRFGVAVARRAWLTSTNVINTLPLPAMQDWLQRRRAKRAA